MRFLPSALYCAMLQDSSSGLGLNKVSMIRSVGSIISALSYMA